MPCYLRWLRSPAPSSITHGGQTGDLAKKKLFPALYTLCLEGRLPRDLSIVGYGRSKVDMAAFLAKQCVNVPDDCSYSKASFCERIQFHAGGYDDPTSYKELDALLGQYEAGASGNRLFFLSVPPTVFGTVAEMVSLHCASTGGGFTRVLIEKPFGRDSASFDELNSLTARHFREAQLFRIDHYLGKEVILNISTLRWANAMFEPLWSGKHIESVQITFKEDIGTEGRGGYFDGFNIVRDIVQNHLLQAFMFLAMEPPAAMTAAALTAAKVELLRSVSTLDLHPHPSVEGEPPTSHGVFLGQFAAGSGQKGYLDDQTVPTGSRCPTFAACVLAVDNERWRGVPFLLSAGKGLDERLCEFRIRFRPQPYNKLLFGADAQVCGTVVSQRGSTIDLRASSCTCSALVVHMAEVYMLACTPLPTHLPYEQRLGVQHWYMSCLGVQHGCTRTPMHVDTHAYTHACAPARRMSWSCVCSLMRLSIWSRMPSSQVAPPPSLKPAQP